MVGPCVAGAPPCVLHVGLVVVAVVVVLVVVVVVVMVVSGEWCANQASYKCTTADRFLSTVESLRCSYTVAVALLGGTPTCLAWLTPGAQTKKNEIVWVCQFGSCIEDKVVVVRHLSSFSLWF